MDTPAGQRFDRYLSLIIMASLVLAMLDSFDNVHSQYAPMLAGIE